MLARSQHKNLPVPLIASGKTAPRVFSPTACSSSVQLCSSLFNIKKFPKNPRGFSRVTRQKKIPSEIRYDPSQHLPSRNFHPNAIRTRCEQKRTGCEPIRAEIRAGCEHMRAKASRHSMSFFKPCAARRDFGMFPEDDYDGGGNESVGEPGADGFEAR